METEKDQAWTDNIPIESKYYPIIATIVDEQKAINRRFYLNELKAIQSGVLEITYDEKELLFEALLSAFIEIGNKAYDDYLEQGIPKNQIMISIKQE